MALTDVEVRAIERALPEVGSYVAETEAGRPVSEWSREEVLGLVRCCWEAARTQMQLMGERDPNDIPF